MNAKQKRNEESEEEDEEGKDGEIGEEDGKARRRASRDRSPQTISKVSANPAASRSQDTSTISSFTSAVASWAQRELGIRRAY